MMYPEQLQVEITLDDLRLGRMADCMSCPIAKALTRLGYSKFMVTERDIAFDNGVTYHTTPAAQRFIKLYDAGYMPKARLFVFPRTHIPASVLAAEVVLT